MNCDEVEELTGAYALGALPAEGLGEIEEHLKTCTRHQAVAELRVVASSLALATPEMEVGPALKTRLMDAVRAEAGPTAVHPERPAFLERLRHLVTRPAFSYSLTAALAVAVIVLLVTSVGDSTTPDRTTVTMAGTEEANAVVHFLEDDLVVIEVDGLEPVGPDETYQVWVITSNKPASLALFNTTPQGEALTAMRADLSGADALAVTVEPAGGSFAPTTDPLLISEDAFPR